MAPFATHVRSITIINAVLVFASISGVAIRLTRPQTHSKRWGAHDIMLIFAVLCGTIMSTLLCLETHFVRTDAEGNWLPLQTTVFYKLFMTLMVFYMACNTLVKLALLCFYRLLTADVCHRRFIMIMTVIAVGFGSSSILVLIFQCQPIRKAWEVAEPGRCIALAPFYYSNASIMIANDVVLYIMPMLFVRGLRLDCSKRIVVNILFSLGAVVIVASVMRLLAVHALFTSGDYIWNMALVLVWSAVENHLAIFISCVPAIKAAAYHYFPALKSLYRSVRSRSQSASSSGPNSGAWFDSTSASTETTIPAKPKHLGRLSAMSEKAFGFLIGVTGLKRGGGAGSDAGDTISMTRDIDLESYYPGAASRNNSGVSADYGRPGKDAGPQATMIELNSAFPLEGAEDDMMSPSTDFGSFGSPVKSKMDW